MTNRRITTSGHRIFKVYQGPYVCGAHMKSSRTLALAAE